MIKYNEKTRRLEYPKNLVWDQGSTVPIDPDSLMKMLNTMANTIERVEKVVLLNHDTQRLGPVSPFDPTQYGDHP